MSSNFKIKMSIVTDHPGIIKDTEKTGSPPPEPYTFLMHNPDFIIFSDAMRKIADHVNLLAPIDVPVLITGETGTGKELIGRALHMLSELRKKRPYVILDATTLNENTIESDLFGHVAGAFTGALRNRDGLFKEANTGTIFIDEISELPLKLQIKLLRVLEAKTVRPLGSDKSMPVDVRLVAATNRDLLSMVAKGQFREDLFFRINVISIEIPPLRERPEDIPILVDHFVKMITKRLFIETPIEFSEGAMASLKAYDWPGNVRELKNVVERAVVLRSGKVIREINLAAKQKPIQVVVPALPVETDHQFELEPEAEAEASDDQLDLEVVGTGSILKDAAVKAARDAERRVIAAALTKNRWNRKKTSEELGISYKALLYKIKLCGLQRNQQAP